MNVYIFADLEGISGIYCPEQVIQGQARHAEGRKYLTREINICASACKAAGVDKVYVRDGHGGSYSLLWDQLSSDVDAAICGITGEVRFAELDDCDAVILLGYHAMAGSHRAILEHSYSSKQIQNIWLNGVKIGEIGLDAAILTELQKPVIMVSGDDKACAEAKAFLPNVVTAEVKKSYASFGTALLSPERAEARIREAVAEAIQNFNAGKISYYPVEKPATLRVELVERQQLPNIYAKPYMTVIDGRTYEVSADTVEAILTRI